MGAGAGVQQAGHCVSQPHLLLVRYHGMTMEDSVDSVDSVDSIDSGN